MSKLYDADSEQALLSGLLSHAINGVVAIEGFGLVPSDFASDESSCVYHLVKSYIDKTASTTIDAAILRLEAKALNLPLDVEYLDNLYASNTPIKDLAAYAKTIKICSLVRKCIHRTTLLLNDQKLFTAHTPYGTLCKVHDDATKDLTDILANATTNEFSHIYSGVQELLDNIVSGKQQVGLICKKFPKLMQAIGGSLRFPSLNVISAMDKVGKSPFCLSIAEDVASQGYPVLYIDTELERDYQACRLLATRTGIPLSRIEYGTFINNPAEEKLIKEDITTGKTTFKIDHFPCAGFLLEDIKILIKRWILSKVGRKPDGTAKDCLVVYDYLKCSSKGEYTTSLAEWQILGLACTELHDLAKQYRVPIVMAAQLNREGSIGASARIDQLCSTRVVLSRKTPEELVMLGKYGNRKLSVARCRFREPHAQNDFLQIDMSEVNGRFTESEWYSKIACDIVINTPQKLSQKKEPHV